MQVYSCIFVMIYPIDFLLEDHQWYQCLSKPRGNVVRDSSIQQIESCDNASSKSCLINDFDKQNHLPVHLYFIHIRNVCHRLSNMGDQLLPGVTVTNHSESNDRLHDYTRNV